MNDILDQIRELLDDADHDDTDRDNFADQVEAILKESPFPPNGVGNMDALPVECHSCWQGVGTQLARDIVELAQLADELRSCGCINCTVRKVSLLNLMMRNVIAMGAIAGRLEAKDGQ